jgi:hypothetical protein
MAAGCETIRSTSQILDVYGSQCDEALKAALLLKVNTSNTSYETQASDACKLSAILICVSRVKGLCV